MTVFSLIITYRIGLTLILINAPLTLGLWIIILSVSMSVSIFSSRLSWFRFILFLIYIGGILIIFSYFSALSPNQHLTLIIPSLLFLLTLTIISLIFLPSLTLSSSLSPDLFSPACIFYIFINKNIRTITFLAIILFLALVVVTKVSLQFKGPLRPFQYV